MLNIYITSAIHNEGKTFLASGLAVTLQSLGYAVSVYKPVQTGGIEINGFMQSPDLTYIKTLDPYINTEFSYLFREKEEPLIAAENENEYIDIDLIYNDFKKLINVSECNILDGEGTLLSPLAPSVQNIDLVKKLQIPVVYSVTPSNDTISTVLPSIYTALDRGIDVRGVVINNILPDCPKELLTSITRIIEEYSGVNILGLLPQVSNPNAPEEIITGILNGIDIESIFGVKIEKLGFIS